MNYYKDLWTKPNQEGTKFFYNVDFNDHNYRLQEHIFRQTLKSLKSLIEHGVNSPIETVLEVGAGTGRMTKIMLEEFPDYDWYTIVEISKDNIKKMFKTLGNGKELPRNVYPISGNIIEYVDLPTKEVKFDLILASEVFMHIKPSDLGPVITKLSKLLAPDHGLIVNIDFQYETALNKNSTWCFIHDYHKLYTTNGLTPIFTRDMIEICQKLFCYGK